MSPKQNRFRLLLDEMLPPRSKFPNLNKYHDLKHVVRDFHLEGISDDKVVKFAKKERRVLISKNSRHMIDLGRINKIKLICITETMDWEEIDSVIMSALRNMKSSDQLIKLSRPVRRKK